MHHTDAKETTANTRKALTLGAMLLASMQLGCNHYNAINFVTNTQFGAKIGVNAEKIPEIQIGYNRQEAARIPVYLMTTKDEVSASTPTINALLSQASAKLEAAKARPWGQTNVDNIVVAQRIITEAARLDKGSSTNSAASFLLREIQIAASKLPLDPAPARAAPATELELVCQMIQAEMVKPAFYAEFREQAKFIGIRDDQSARDAYSVLGTFSGNMSSSSTTGAGPEANLKGGIAQYFATGIAAQLLAEKGGAALVSTAPTAKPPGDIDPEQVERIKKETLVKMRDAEAVASFVWKDTAAANAPNTDERKVSLTAAFQGVKIDDDTPQTRETALTYYAQFSDQVSLTRNLANDFSAEDLALMVSNVNH